MLGVVLAAGSGRRMGWLGREYPKAMLPVGTRSLLSHHLELFASLGVDRAVVVVGQDNAEIQRELTSRVLAFPVEIVTQPMPTGSGAALLSALPLLDEPFVVLLADCYIRMWDILPLRERLLRGENSLIVVGDDDARRLRAGCVVEADQSGRIVALIEKPKSPPRVALRACGIYTLTPDVGPALVTNEKSVLRNEYELTTALDSYCRGVTVYADALAEWDYNITDPADLLACNLAIVAGCNLVSPSARVAADVKLDRVVVGPDAEISAGVTLRECVVFPRTQARTSARRALVTPMRTLCP